MALVIGSIPTSNSQFQALKLRLLLSYLGVMVTILGTTGIAIHQFVAQSIYQQLDRHLLTLAETAAQTFDIVKHEASEHKKGYDDDDKYEQNSAKNITNLMEGYQNNQFLNLPILPNHFQGVEWFNEKHQLLVKEGNLFPNWSLDTKLIKAESSLIQKDQIRSLILPVMYVNHHTGKPQIAGYIRASESIQPLELELSHLRWGLSLGGIFALILTGLGGVWLTSQAIRPVEKSFEQLKQFTSDASHELRSPLTVIKTSLDILESHSENLDLQDRKKVNAIAHSADQMTHLVEDLLLLAKMEQPTITKTWIKVPLEEILEDLIDELEIKFEQNNINFKYYLLANIFVNGDALQLKRIFTNLLENALQYTPIDGEIELKMQSIKEQIIITVTDSGIGIAKTDLDHVFDRFWRADQAREKRSGGMGMGLAIAKSIANKHGGKITVTSELGVGSCFKVQLPFVY